MLARGMVSHFRFGSSYGRFILTIKGIGKSMYTASTHSTAQHSQPMLKSCPLAMHLIYSCFDLVVCSVVHLWSILNFGKECVIADSTHYYLIV